jgi:GNAT superfamily N-acetyltransferase
MTGDGMVLREIVLTTSDDDDEAAASSISSTTNDLQALVILADDIWHEFFPALLAPEQIDYMVERFQSRQAIEQQLREGYRYFFLLVGDETVGYLGIQPRVGVNAGAGRDEGAGAEAAAEAAASAGEGEGESAGVRAGKRERSGTLFISKLYVRATARGLGVGRFTVEQCVRLAQQAGLGHLSLTCNKYNTSSLAFYKRCGFEIVGATVNDIGAGFVMDDYLLELVVA